MAKEETIGFVGLSFDDPNSLDGPPCHICGMIMVRVMPCSCDNEGLCGFSHEGLWLCKSCGATTGCTEVKDGEKQLAKRIRWG